MEIKNVLVDDTNGQLETDQFKLHPEKQALSVWLTEDLEANKRVVKLSPNNIRFASIPNMDRSTYITFLAYNGTLGLSNKVFSTVVEQDQGVVDLNASPIMTYNPNNTLMPKDLEELNDTVIDIKFYNGTVDIITYQEGVLFQGEKQYLAKSIRSYPTRVSRLPQLDYKKVFLDGWYSYTHVMYRDLLVGAQVTEKAFYSYQGEIFQASDTGTFGVNLDDGRFFILVDEVTTVYQSTDIDYKEVLFSLNADSATSAHGNSVFLHSQVLITEEIRDAIVKETLNVAMCACSGLDFADWQKLTLKRNAAMIMFQNELYENSQIILESARSQCVNTSYEPCNC